MKTVGQSIVKAENDTFENGIERHNEDALNISVDKLAVCDGAGGIGILADKWSETLAANIPDEPFENAQAVDKWIAGFWEDFYNSHIQLVQNDPWKIKKFEEEGSLATLLALWHLKGNKFVCQTYGDTVYFIYNTKENSLRIQENMRSINSFNLNPPLINWQTEHIQATDFYTYKIELKPSEQLILASDGIAMYIHAAYLSYSGKIGEEITETKMQKIADYFTDNPIKDFKQWLDKLKEALADEKAFKELASDWHKNKALPNDDYTLVFVELPGIIRN